MNLAVSFVVKICSIVAYGFALILFKVIVFVNAFVVISPSLLYSSAPSLVSIVTFMLSQNL